jgi:hypothetical protein
MEQGKLDYTIADLSLFAFDNLIKRETLISQLENSNLDMRVEVPRAIFDLIQDNKVAFQRILEDINPNAPEVYLNDITSFLSKNSNIIPSYDLGTARDFDYLPEDFVRMIVGKIFRRAPDRINKYHIAYYYQLLHAIEIGRAQSKPIRRKFIGYVHNFKK